MKFEKLGNIITIHKGRKNSIVEIPDSNSKRVLQIDDLRNDNLLQYTNDVTGVFVTEDDIMIAWDGANAGTIGYGKRGYIGSTIAALRKKTSHYDTVFLGKFLQTQFSYLQKNATGATIPHIDRKSLENIKVPILKIEDQIRIAKLLSKVENLIKQRKESIDLLDSFLKSTFLKMFGTGDNSSFPTKLLSDVSLKITDGEHGTVKRLETGRLYLMARNITRFNELDFEEVTYISEEAHQKIFKRCNPEKGDLLMVCVGATIGKVALVPDMEEFSLARSVALIKPNYEIINSYYLLSFFNSDFGERQIKSGSKEAAQAGLYTGNLKKIKIPVPPIQLQNQFAQISERTKVLKTQYQNSLQELKKLFASLSQKVFKGELDLSKMEVDETLLPKLEASEKKIEIDNPNVSKALETAASIYKHFEKINEFAKSANRFNKYFEQWDKLIKPLNKLPKIPTELIEAQQKIESIKSAFSLVSPLPIDKSEKLKWESVSFQQVSNWIRENYTGFYFSSEMLINFLMKDHVTFPDYYSSEELKKFPQTNEADDLKSFISSAVNKENPFIQLEQVFYNAETENIKLKLTQDDYILIKDRTAQERSGIYFKIVPDENN